MKKKLLYVILIVCLAFPSAALGHSGRTNSAGGHKDNKNASGLGSYHYHHGYGPHLHPNGECPYSSNATAASTKKSSNSTATIKAAQQKLKNLGYYDGVIDGSFGPKSKEALKKFQKDNNLVVDGSLGPKSKQALGI